MTDDNLFWKIYDLLEEKGGMAENSIVTQICETTKCDKQRVSRLIQSGLKNMDLETAQGLIYAG